VKPLSMGDASDMISRAAASGLVMTIYSDGSYNIQSGSDDMIEENCVLDYLTSIPLQQLISDICKVL